MHLSRRDCVQALVAGAVSARLGAAWAADPAGTMPAAEATRNADAELRAALDALLPPRGDAASRLATLARFDPATLSPPAAVDLLTVRAGLALDARGEALGARSRDADRYALQVERSLGEAIPPATAHRLLETEVRRISARAGELLRGLGHRRGSLGERFLAAAGDPRWLYADDDAGRGQAIADMNQRLGLARAQLPLWFADVPAWCLAVQVDGLSAAELAAGKPGYRRLPTPQEAGAYVVDLREIRRRPRWSLASVVHHELLPGHLLQMPLEAAVHPHPLRLDYLRAFPEGWATYAEELAASNGAFHDDPWSELGLMHWLMFRALRGLVDSGLHHAGWSRARALQALQQTQGLPAYFAAFEPDLERIMAEPGPRAAEALAWLRLRELRDRCTGRGAAAGLGLRGFHALVLQAGRKPMALLAGEVAGAARHRA